MERCDGLCCTGQDKALSEEDLLDLLDLKAGHPGEEIRLDERRHVPQVVRCQDDVGAGGKDGAMVDAVAVDGCDDGLGEVAPSQAHVHVVVVPLGVDSSGPWVNLVRHLFVGNFLHQQPATQHTSSTLALLALLHTTSTLALSAPQYTTSTLALSARAMRATRLREGSFILLRLLGDRVAGRPCVDIGNKCACTDRVRVRMRACVCVRVYTTGANTFSMTAPCS